MMWINQIMKWCLLCLEQTLEFEIFHQKIFKKRGFNLQADHKASKILFKRPVTMLKSITLKIKEMKNYWDFRKETKI